MWSRSGPGEEGLAFGRVVSELKAQDAEGAWGVAEAACDFGRGELINEVGAEGFVLVLRWGVGGQEELGGLVIS